MISRVPARGLPALLLVLGALTLARIVALSFSVVDLFPDEAQYWVWSREWALGYFSKPPLLAWVIGAATAICGNAEPCIRAPAPLFYFGTSVLAYFIGKMLYDGRTAFWAGLTMALGTGVVFSARIISTDVPLLFFWALALLSYVKIVEYPDSRWAVALGASIGLGLLAKYAMIYFLLGIGLAAALDGEARRVLRDRTMWLALGIAVVLVAPNIYWNVTHDLVTLRSTRAVIVGAGEQASLLMPLEFLGAQFVVGGPIVFAVLILATVRIRDRTVLRADRLMLAFALPPLVIVTVTALAVKVNANWAAPSFVSATVLAAAWLVRRNALGWLKAGVLLGGILQILLFVGDSMATRVNVPLLGKTRGDLYYRTLGWRSFAVSAGDLSRRIGATAIVGDERRDVASLLYYWRDHGEPILAWPTGDKIQFETTRAFTGETPDPVLFVSECPFPERLQIFYTRVDRIAEIVSPAGPNSFRWHGAFRLEGRRAPIRPLSPCIRPQ
jgi:4-amino-4-deoxy-L-arabinose transferase-like glycosyltransferase